MILAGNAPHVECSSKGLKRFSAYYAKVNGKSIEEIYQSSKIFEDGSTGLSPKEAKSKQKTVRVINLKECHSKYRELWQEYLVHNPEYIDQLREFSGLSDIFGQEGHICQAEVLWDYISQIRNDPVFVFGSNKLGIHGKGAAKYAQLKYGAMMYRGRGRIGRSAYAIPTKDDPKSLHVSYSELAEYVHEFKEYSEKYPKTTFHLSKIGCGLAGMNRDEVKSIILTANLPTNVVLPGTWTDNVRRLIIAGTRDPITPYQRKVIEDNLDDMLSHNPHWDEIIVGRATGVDTIGEDWADSRGLKVNPFPADWHLFKNSAGPIRNREMAWRGTHLVAFWDGRSTGTEDMITQAKVEGLISRTILI